MVYYEVGFICEENTVLDAFKGEHLPTLVGSYDELHSGQDPGEDDKLRRATL